MDFQKIERLEEIGDILLKARRGGKSRSGSSITLDQKCPEIREAVSEGMQRLSELEGEASRN